MRGLIVLLLFGCLLPGAAFADDFASGVEAYRKQDFDGAFDRCNDLRGRIFDLHEKMAYEASARTTAECRRLPAACRLDLQCHRIVLCTP